MHLYIKTSDSLWTIGFLIIQKTNGTNSFVPLFDVATRTDAAIAVNALNGGDAGSLQRINITKEYVGMMIPIAT